MSRLHRPSRDLTVAQAQPFHLIGGETAILLIHGFTGTTGHMRPLGDRLHQQGYTVQGINLPGHGTRWEDMANCTAATWLEAAKNAVQTLRQQHKQVFAAGLSMGGVLSLLLAEEGLVDGICTISAPMDGGKAPIALAKAASIFLPRFWWRYNPQREAQLDPAYDLGYPCFPTQSATELNALIRKARMNLSQINCPLLVVQSRKDETISPNSSNIICSNCASTRVERLWLEDAPHVATLSAELPRIADAMVSFFANDSPNLSRL